MGTGKTGTGTGTDLGMTVERTGMAAGVMHMVTSGIAEAGGAEAGPETGRQAGVDTGILRGAHAILNSL